MNYPKLPKPKKLPLKVMNNPMVAKAFALSMKMHKGRVRRGECEFNHIQRVAYSAYMKNKTIDINFDIVVAALLHDCVEDGLITFDKLSKLFPKVIVSCLRFLTKKTCYFNYIQNMSRIHDYWQRFVVLQVKKSDLRDNIYKLEDGHRKDKYMFALDYINKIEDVISLSERKYS